MRSDFDVTYEPTAEAGKATFWPMQDIRFYESSLDGLVSVVTYLDGHSVGRTRLDIGQVIDLHERLEEFIDRHAVPPTQQCGTPEEEAAVPTLVEEPRPPVRRSGW